MSATVGRRLRESYVTTLLLTAVFALTLMQYVLPMLLLLPLMCLPFVGMTLYRTLTGMYDRWALFALFAVIS